MTQLTTTDGNVLSVDSTDLTKGVSVYQIDENGNLTPAKNGDYTFEDGRVISVTGGKITTVSGEPTSPDDTVSPETEMATEPTTDTASGEAEDTKSDNDLANQIAELSARIDALEQMLPTVSGATEALMSRVEKLSKEPATESIKTQKTFSSNGEVKSIADYKKIFRD